MTPSEIAAGQQMKDMLGGVAPEQIMNPEPTVATGGTDDLTAEMMRLAGVPDPAATPVPQPPIPVPVPTEPVVVPEQAPTPTPETIPVPAEPVAPDVPTPEEGKDNSASLVDLEMEKLLDELIEEQAQGDAEPTPEEAKPEDPVDNKGKESIIDEELLVENKSLRNKVRSSEEDKNRFENQSKQRKTKAEEVSFELENVKLQLKTGANIPGELKEFAQDFSTRENAENPTILEKRNVLLHVGKIYKQLTGQNIDGIINSHLRGSSQTVTPSGGLPAYSNSPVKTDAKKFAESIF